MENRGYYWLLVLRDKMSTLKLTLYIMLLWITDLRLCWNKTTLKSPAIFLSQTPKPTLNNPLLCLTWVGGWFVWHSFFKLLHTKRGKQTESSFATLVLSLLFQISFWVAGYLLLGGNIISWLKGVMRNYEMLTSGMIKMVKGANWKIFREKTNLTVQEETLLKNHFSV